MHSIDAEIDLVETLESGQTFVWRREGDVFTTAIDGKGVRVKDADRGVAYEGDVPEERLRETLGLDAPHDEIKSEIDGDERVRRAIEEYPGLRVVSDDFFACVVSFIISAQNRIPRIRKLVQEIAVEYGEEVGYGAYSFPEPEALARAGESELRELGLGYRAPYVTETARMVADGEFDPETVERMEYHDAHDEMKRLVGVGDKVADCVLLFSLGFYEAVPLDTWMEKTMREYYPELVGDSYMETCDRFRGRFGEYAGYAQNFLFHYIRHHG